MESNEDFSDQVRNKSYGKMEEPKSVAVCIATYDRPLGLVRLLASLQNQIFKNTPPPKWEIVIVENDISAVSKEHIDQFKLTCPIPITYSIEPQKGISSARNRAVKIAGQMDYIAFIDDDEVAHPYWLDQLLYAQQVFSADIVKGPVLPLFEQPPPLWIIEGNFFTRKRYPTGTKFKYGGTGNVLINTKWFRLFDEPFDESLNLSGGEDTLFFAKVNQLGAISIWSDEAIAEEYNSPQRTTASWILRRALRDGSLLSSLELQLNPSVFIYVGRIFKCLVHLIGGTLLLIPAAIVFGYSGLIRSLSYICRGIGEITGFLGGKYEIYK